MCVRVHVCVHVGVGARTCVCVCVRVHVCVHVGVGARTCVCVDVHVYSMLIYIYRAKERPHLLDSLNTDCERYFQAHTCMSQCDFFGYTEREGGALTVSSI